MGVLLRFIPWLKDLIKSLLTYFGISVGQRLLTRAAVLAAFIGLAAALTSALVGIVALLNYTHPNNWFYVGIGLMPANTIPCVSAYLSAAVVRLIYDSYIANAKMDAQVSMIRG